MTIADDMTALADALMDTYGQPAEYRPGGDEGMAVQVTVRCKPQRVLAWERRMLRIMDISVRAADVPTPYYGDVFVVHGLAWTISALPVDTLAGAEIASHAGGALWQIIVMQDSVPTLRGGLA